MMPAYLPLLRALLPETLLVAGGLLVLAADLFGGRKLTASGRQNVATYLGLLAILGAAAGGMCVGAVGPVFGQVLMLDPLAVGARLAILLLAGLSLALLPGTRRMPHSAEFVAIVLFATTGFTLMAAAQQLLLGFLALELASLSLYILAGLDKTRAESAEAGLKYFLFGGVSAAFLLFGFSLIYGLTGSIELPEIAHRLAWMSPSPLLAIALVMILVGFGYKAAAAPFHLWAPDVYQGAPAPSAALIASASKLAGFTLFWRLLWPGFGVFAGDQLPQTGTASWLPVVLIISAASMLLGNIAALAQSNVRRLLAYSAIAHAGALLLGIVSAGQTGPAPLFFYLTTYGLATVGAFGVIGVVEESGRCQKLTDLAGLRERSPFLAGILFICILSLAGVPPLAGFFGKFVVFSAALKLHGMASPSGWLSLLAIMLSAVGLYYYLAILKQAFVVAKPAEAKPIATPFSATVALLIAAMLLILFGLNPNWLLALVA